MRGNKGITKSKIDKIGKRIEKKEEILDDDLKTLNEFRFWYRDLIQGVESHFSTFNEVKFTSSTRLKRTPSIISKLRRSSDNGKSTRLSSMQDIGGCRFIFENIDDLFKFSNWLENNLSNYIFKKKFDYIKTSKSDGYKSIHYVLTDSISGLTFEIQVRTAAQHYWSTAVEILDMITMNPIKQGKGKQNHRKFFKYMSSIVALEDGIKEKSRNKAFREIPKLIHLDNIIDTLANRAMYYDFYKDKIAKLIAWKYNKKRDSQVTGEIILLFTHKQDSTFDVEGKHNLSLEGAREYYYKMEKLSVNDPTKDLVIISSTELVEAYPNYAGDARKFINIYKKYQTYYKK